MKLVHAVKYGTWLYGQVLVGAWDILRRTLTGDMGYCPVVIPYPLRVTSPRDIAALSTSITMTPGTMSIGLREPDSDGTPRVLLVQAVFGQDPEAIIADIRDMEARLNPSVADAKETR